jgi:hypothetical protein
MMEVKREEESGEGYGVGGGGKEVQDASSMAKL